MATIFVFPVLMRVRWLRPTSLFIFSLAVGPAAALGQVASLTSANSGALKPEPKKVWTEDELAGLMKPWDLYRIEQVKKSALAAAAPVTQATPASSSTATLQTMDTREFNHFLKVLDSDTTGWRGRLKNIDIADLGMEYQEQDEVARRYDFCQETLDRIQDEIAQLSKNQTLKLDLLLLIDLNALARSFDGLSVDLASPLTAPAKIAEHASIGWAQEVLDIDQELARLITEFQYHTLAFAGVLETALDKAHQEADQPK
jgi:hypothetical protein